jgi:predicted nucleic acid-binding protein
MTKIRTYVDACVLIYAFRGPGDLAEAARLILDDSNREFVASEFLRMETLAKAQFNKQQLEINFYEEYFRNVVAWADINDSLIKAALNECTVCGVNAFDALHLACAAQLKANEFITAEKVHRSIYRGKIVAKITNIRP